MATTLFISGLAYHITSKTLWAKFEEFGAVDKANVAKDRNTGRSHGFGNMTYEKSEDADAAVAAMNRVEFAKTTVRIDKVPKLRSAKARHDPRATEDVERAMLTWLLSTTQSTTNLRKPFTELDLRGISNVLCCTSKES
jgi:RNA recognition motif-containing protein